MSTTPTAIATGDLSSLQRLRNFVGAAAFLFIQRSPKLLQLHRNEKSWTLFRIALGIFGAALVVLPLSLWHGWFTAIFGLLLFVTSILLPPAETPPCDVPIERLEGQLIPLSVHTHEELNDVLAARRP